MSRPRPHLLRMVLFIVAVGCAAAFGFEPLSQIFRTNTLFNGVILGVLALGLLFNFRQVLSLWPEVEWIRAFRQGRPTVTSTRLRLLAPMAAMVGERRGRLTLSPAALRSLLDGIASRLDESRELSRYTTQLLIFLGLLGTFWGLSLTVGSIGDVIRSLRVDGTDLAAMFTELKRGLEAPIGGMGTAFSSSLFGLGGALVLGFLDLQAGQAQNRFYTDLEDWLAESTRLTAGAAVGDGETSVPAYVQALLEQTAESLGSVERLLTRGEEARAAVGGSLLELSEKLGALADQMRTEQQLMLRLAESQAELKPLLARMTELLARPPQPAVDEATRGHIRNLELYVARLIDELANGREDLIRQVRSDIKFLARTIAAVAEEGERRPGAD